MSHRPYIGLTPAPLCNEFPFLRDVELVERSPRAWELLRLQELWELHCWGSSSYGSLNHSSHSFYSSNSSFSSLMDPTTVLDCAADFLGSYGSHWSCRSYGADVRALGAMGSVGAVGAIPPYSYTTVAPEEPFSGSLLLFLYIKACSRNYGTRLQELAELSGRYYLMCNLF